MNKALVYGASYKIKSIVKQIEKWKTMNQYKKILKTQKITIIILKIKSKKSTN